MIHSIVAGLAAATFLGCGSLVWLRRAGYPRKAAALLAAAVLAQAGPFLAVTASRSLWLAVGVFAVAWSAAAFARQAEPRRIIVFGGSLALIQFLDPLGGLVAAGLLPATLVIGRDRGDRQQQAGLYVLLMFMPLMAAAFLLYLAKTQHFGPASLLAPPAVPARFLAQHAGLLWRLGWPLGMAAIAAPALLGVLVPGNGRLREAPVRAVVLVALGVAAAAVASVLLGAIREPVALLAAAAPITTAALSHWPQTPARSRNALVAAVLSAALSWAIVLLS